VTAPRVGAAWRTVRDRFRAAGLEQPEVDARFLAEAAFGFDHAGLLRHETDTAPEAGLGRLEAFAERRLKGEPVARIIGSRDFFGGAYALNSGTLVPRPETELVVSLGVAALAGHMEPRILDLGTGSGCIAIALLEQLPTASAVAVDLSVEALDAARANAVRHHVADRLMLSAGRWFDPLGPDERFDLIVSNPPYIEREAIDGLAVEVREFDPRLALDGGPDGLDAYRAILGSAGKHLARDGRLILEIGAGQGATVPALARDHGYTLIALEKDLAGLDRVVVLHHSQDQ
jgi:release factor glutamine methyltransferase